MQPADYRLVRSHVRTGVTMAIKRRVLGKTIDHYFSSWLYGEDKSIRQLPVDLPGSTPCLVCSDEKIQREDFSLLTVEHHLFLRCLPALNTEQLCVLHSLLSEDQQSYQHAVREQYRDYKGQLLETWRRRRNRQF